MYVYAQAYVCRCKGPNGPTYLNDIDGLIKPINVIKVGGAMRAFMQVQFLMSDQSADWVGAPAVVRISLEGPPE